MPSDSPSGLIPINHLRNPKDLYGQAKDSAGDAIDAVAKFSGTAEDAIRDYIENRPYTSVAMALALGWLIGRSHRPF